MSSYDNVGYEELVKILNGIIAGEVDDYDLELLEFRVQQLYEDKDVTFGQHLMLMEMIQDLSY